MNLSNAKWGPCYKQVATIKYLDLYILVQSLPLRHDSSFYLVNFFS